MLYRIQVRRLSWQFYSFQIMILKIVLNNYSSVRLCIIIHQNVIVTISIGIGADIWIIPLSHTSQNSTKEYMHLSWTIE